MRDFPLADRSVFDHGDTDQPRDKHPLERKRGAQDRKAVRVAQAVAQAENRRLAETPAGPEPRRSGRPTGTREPHPAAAAAAPHAAMRGTGRIPPASCPARGEAAFRDNRSNPGLAPDGVEGAACTLRQRGCWKRAAWERRPSRTVTDLLEKPVARNVGKDHSLALE